MKGYYLLPLLVFVILGFFLGRGLFLDPHELPSVQIGKALEPFDLASFEKNQRFSSQHFKGQVVLLNVWASWCEACNQEQVFLMKLANQGVSIYGLNYKDNLSQAKQWLNEWGNPYRAIGQDRKGEVAINLGVYGAPETFLIDKKGIIRFRHVGILDEKSWLADFLPLISQLEKA